jgi:uncharacterized coiled-coil protein SlyX
VAEERIEKLTASVSEQKTRIWNLAEELKNMRQVLANHIGKK